MENTKIPQVFSLWKHMDSALGFGGLNITDAL